MTGKRRVEVSHKRSNSLEELSLMEDQITNAELFFNTLKVMDIVPSINSTTQQWNPGFHRICRKSFRYIVEKVRENSNFTSPDSGGDKTKNVCPKYITVTTFLPQIVGTIFRPLLLSQSQRKGASL